MTIRHIGYNYPNIKFLVGSKDIVKTLYDEKINKNNIIYIPNQNWWDLGIIKVKLEQLQHDTINHALKWEYAGKLGIYIVDTANVDGVEAKNYDLFLIESNYNEELLNQHIQECIDNGDNENKLYYLNRVSHAHLSDTQCNDFLINNMGNNSSFEYIHKSNYNFKEETENV